MSGPAVVTGAAGFLGRALVARLLGEGDEVRAVVLPGDSQLSGLQSLAADFPNLCIVPADVCDREAMRAACHGADTVFHAAALVHAWAPREEFHRVNVGGAESVAEAVLANGARRLVAVSTTDVFGMPQGERVFDERSPFRSWDEPYADTKIEAEKRLWALGEDRGLPLTVVYPGWVYGPGDRAFFPGLARAIAEGRMFFWSRGARLPFVYIDNLVDACLLAACAERAAGEGYIVFDTDEGPTMEELCAHIADAIAAKRPTRHLPYRAVLATAWALQTIRRLAGARTPPPLLTVDVKAFGPQFHLSADKIRRTLGWTSRVDIEEGMRRALGELDQWYRPT